MKRHGSVNVIFYFPDTDDAKCEMAERIAEIHADAVNRRITELNCPNAQKRELLEAVIETVKRRNAKDERDR